jgi:hypothetical protein
MSPAQSSGKHGTDGTDAMLKPVTDPEEDLKLTAIRE